MSAAKYASRMASARASTNRSAGVLLWRRREGRLEVLLGHPGGPFYARRDEGAWTIFKGQPDPGESDEDAARRELREESGIAFSGPLVPLGEVRQKGGKVVIAFAGEGDADPATLSSEPFEMEWPPGSGRTGRFPEVDRYGWFGLEEAARRILPAQAAFLARLTEALR
jgi:predicted NUDIX family NTP pyrophosphohydrolase